MFNNKVGKGGNPFTWQALQDTYKALKKILDYRQSYHNAIYVNPQHTVPQPVVYILPKPSMVFNRNSILGPGIRKFHREVCQEGEIAIYEDPVIRSLTLECSGCNLDTQIPFGLFEDNMYSEIKKIACQVGKIEVETKVDELENISNILGVDKFMVSKLIKALK